MSQTERALREGVDELDDVDFDDTSDDGDDGVLDDVAVDDPVIDEVVDADLDQPTANGDRSVDGNGDGGDDAAAEPYVLPPIIMATEADDDDPDDDHDVSPIGDPLLARRLPGATEADDRTAHQPTTVQATTVQPTTLQPAVSDDILDELRQADIDGPTVAPAPQDDSSAGIRRPLRAPDYDPAPFPIPVKVPRLLGRKPRVRRVTRVVRHVDPWSVFKIAIVANVVLYVILLTAGVLLWNVAYATGTVDNVERFFESFGWSEFEFNGGEIYHNAWIGGIFLIIGLTGLAVLMATLFNLITDLVGGIRLTVLEEEVVEARTSPMRRFVVRRAEPEVPVVMYDDSGPIIREAVVDDAGGPAR